MIFYR